MHKPVMNERERADRRWCLAGAAGWLAFFVVGLVYLWVGEPNADEGYYLYASRLVYEGQELYRDFAFVQMPLLPYVYGLPQRLLGPSLLLGRATSLLLTAASLVTLSATARRHGGMRAAAWTILLAGTFSFGLYHLTIVKTYALVLTCFSLSLWFLTSRWPEEIALPAAVFCALASGATRLSAALFVLPIFFYTLIRARRWHTRALILATLAVVGLVILGLLRHWGDIAIFNVWTYHMNRWGTTQSPQARVQQVLAIRLPSLLRQYGLLTLVSSSLFACWLTPRRWRSLWPRVGPWAAYALGIALFAASHTVGGGWHDEYMVPAAMGAMPIIGLLAGSATAPAAPERRLATCLLCALLIGLPMNHWADHRALLGQQAGPQGIRQVAELVRSESETDDRLLIISALWVAIDADRHVLPGLSMAHSSLVAGDRADAVWRKAVTGDMVVEMVDQRQPKVVVLTQSDRNILAILGQGNAMDRALEAHYDLIYTTDTFGQGRTPVWVYRRRP